jgi:hypothetical protein
VLELEQRALRHEGVIRLQLEERGGISGPEMQGLIELFGGWRHHPQPDALPEALETIQRLRLLALPEHKFGVAGAVMAACERHPEHAEALRGSYRALLSTIERAAPHLPRGDVSSPDEVEYLWMYWMVTGTPSILSRISGLIDRCDAVGKHAAGYLVAHSYLPEVAAEIQRLDSRNSMMYGVPVPGQSRTGIPAKQVHELVLALMALPGGRQRAVQVGWITALDSYEIFTRDGQTWPHAPAVWEGKPVLVQRASAEQLAVHRILLDAADEV